MAWWTLPFGLLVGLVMGSLGGGGAILTVPLLVYLLHQSPHAAAEGSLVIIAISSLIGLWPHARAGRVRWLDGLVFGALGIVGSMVGSAAAARIPGELLLSLFSALLLVVAGVMLRSRRRGRPDGSGVARPFWQLLLTATGVGLLTGFFGVGGGFAVVPALILVLGFGVREAIATSLLVIAINCLTALASRLAIGVHLDWAVILPFALGASAGSLGGARIARRADPAALQLAFAWLLVLLSVVIGAQNIPRLF
ncbi:MULTISPECIES: sulfite exporter TauE/SafE family protein [unclassified Luteococcus]|uniref:sulfite exporter TauE/SafE family protein n=1 Tax=unclassified Luteococcus TaxID=2639923 RepID=UPI00313CF7AE